jgi:hypothetical protein
LATCPGYVAGVYITGGTTGDAIVQDNIESGAFYGILTDDDSSSTIISNVLAPVLCESTVTGPNTGLNAGWVAPANLSVKTIPACALAKESAQGNFTGVFINGVAYVASRSATKKTIVLDTNAGGAQVAKGATVIFNNSAAPFLQDGIACGSQLEAGSDGSTCAISDNTVTGGGTVYGDAGAGTSLQNCLSGQGIPPVGILGTNGDKVDVDGNSVSDVADSIANCPEAGETTNDGIGIGLLPGADGPGKAAGNSVVGVNINNNPNTGNGNKLGGTSANDVGITLDGGTNTAGWQVNGNTVTAANKAGIVLKDLEPTTDSLASDVESNSVGGVTTGAGIAVFGVNCANGGLASLAATCTGGFGGSQGAIGGPLGSEGNTASGNGIGIIVACDPSTAETEAGEACQNSDATDAPSDFNLLENNTADNNELYGELTVGAYQPEEIEAQITPTGSHDTSRGNVFNDDSWTGNGAGAPLVDGTNVMDGTGWGGGCVSETGDCGAGGALTYEGANIELSSANPGTGTLSLSVCNTGSTSVVLPKGSEITFYPSVTADSGTFFTTADTIVTPDLSAGCLNTDLYSTLTVQALNPEEVGTDVSPTGQPYQLGTGATVSWNSNGVASASPSLESYGTNASGNSCTPAGVNLEPNIFGATSTGNYTYSPTLGVSTGGVNATYAAC